MVILIGVVVGLVLGLTGAGGSIFAVPLLMAVLSMPIIQASTVSLLAVAVAAAVGTGMAWRHSYVRYRAASLMALAALNRALTHPAVNQEPQSAMRPGLSYYRGANSRVQPRAERPCAVGADAGVQQRGHRAVAQALDDDRGRGDEIGRSVPQRVGAEHAQPAVAVGQLVLPGRLHVQPDHLLAG